MKYAIISIFVLLFILILVVFLLKKSNSKKTFIIPSKVNKPIYENIEDNSNPTFEVELIDYKKSQLGINKSSLGEPIYFKKGKNKRINVYTTNKIYIGQIAIKDYKKFNLIANKPNFFEGTIFSFKTDNIITKKVIISIQAKIEFSKQIYLLDKTYLNTIITLSSLFVPDEIIETNYGAATIISVYNDHLLVDVPPLGNREIYDIDPILNPKK